MGDSAYDDTTDITIPSRGEHKLVVTKCWATIEIIRSAYADIEADNPEQAYEKVQELLEEGEIQGWEEDVPQIELEELPEEDA